ncbi:MAG: 6-carboxytetrahydropterin synthase QueD [Dehalococcoidia bacterium]|nr:6-carboxytetrahydropterin synthase QueD [Dehalococcoidia bacterium]
MDQDFDAAHFLRGYTGKCERLHGHRFRVQAALRMEDLDHLGMAYDFTVLRKHLQDIVSALDHTSLNDAPPFDKINPSSENLARTIFNDLKVHLGNVGSTLHSVTVWESPESRATYTP